MNKQRLLELAGITEGEEQQGGEQPVPTDPDELFAEIAKLVEFLKDPEIKKKYTKNTLHYITQGWYQLENATLTGDIKRKESFIRRGLTPR